MLFLLVKFGACRLFSSYSSSLAFFFSISLRLFLLFSFNFPCSFTLQFYSNITFTLVIFYSIAFILYAFYHILLVRIFFCYSLVAKALKRSQFLAADSLLNLPMREKNEVDIFLSISRIFDHCIEFCVLNSVNRRNGNEIFTLATFPFDSSFIGYRGGGEKSRKTF